MQSIRCFSAISFFTLLAAPVVAHAQEATVSAEAAVAAPAAAPVAAPMTAPPPVVVDPNAAQVTVESGGRRAIAIDLVPVNGGQAAHCDATPCPLTLPPGTYRLHTGGQRVHDVDQNVDLATGHNSIHVRPGNPGSFITGAVLVGIGGAVFIAGGVTAGYFFYEGAANNALWGYIFGGVFTVLTLAISVPFGAAGGVMMGRGHSEVRVERALHRSHETPMQWAVLPTVTHEGAGLGFVARF